jgi:MFS family permease
MSASTEQNSASRVLAASLVGTAVEFYDFYIYATAASLIFGALFFPHGSETAQLVMSYATFGVAFVARPLGAAVFGHFGDRVGRKSTLVASLLLMGGSTFAVGLLPGYAAIGLIAPALLCLLRFGQGLGLGGEWGGAALLAVENAPPGYRARYGMFPQLGAPVGFIASNGIFLTLGLALEREQFQSWGWRIPFLCSAVLVAVGLWVRFKLTESPAFARAIAEAPPPRVPLKEVIVQHTAALIAGTFAVIACYAIFYLSTAFALGYATTALHLARNDVLAVQLVAILFMALGIVVSGYAADRRTPRHVLRFGCVCTIGVGFLTQPLMGAGSLLGLCGYLSLTLFTMGLVYGPLGAWLPSLFPARVRYTGASMAFNVGGILGGGLAPLVAQLLATTYGLFAVGIYLSAAGLVSFVALSLRDARPYA